MCTKTCKASRYSRKRHFYTVTVQQLIIVLYISFSVNLIKSTNFQNLRLNALWWHFVHRWLIILGIAELITSLPHILSLPLINQINSLHISRHFQISRQIPLFIHRLSWMMDAPPSVCLLLICIFSVCIISREYFYLSVFAMPVVQPPPFLGALPLPCHSHQYLHSHDFYFGPIIPLGHQPGSLLHQQCHPFLCKSWCLHTKLPICTLPALRCLHGSRGPEEHAPAAGRSSALRRPAWPLPAGAHRLPTWLPR